MEMNILIIIALVLVIIGLIIKVISVTKSIKPKETAFDKVMNTFIILDIVKDTLPKAFEVAIANKAEGGYHKVRSLVLQFVIDEIKASDKFNEEQKDFITSQVIIDMVDPLFNKLWDMKFEMPQKNITKAALAKVREDERNIQKVLDQVNK